MSGSGTGRTRLEPGRGSTSRSLEPGLRSASRSLERVVARDLVKTFGRATVALRGVSATIEAGRLTLIEGANGSGKSTLLGVLGAVVRPSSGEVVYEPFGDDAEGVRGLIGWVSHETLGYPDLTGRQNIELAARLQGLDVEEAWRAAAERFELGAFALRPLRTNSRGQRQRVAMARALVHRPALLLLDEPTTGLDKAGVARLCRVVDEEVADGAVVAVVSHEPALWGDRVVDKIVLERGRVVATA